MVTKVNGGVPQDYQNLAGHLSFVNFAVTNVDFTKSVADGTTDLMPGGEPYAAGTVLPGSDLEILVESVSTRSTVVILQVASATSVDMAIENAGDAWFYNPAPDSTVPGASDPTAAATIDAAFAANGNGTTVTTVTAGTFAVDITP